MAEWGRRHSPQRVAAAKAAAAGRSSPGSSASASWNASVSSDAGGSSLRGDEKVSTGATSWQSGWHGEAKASTARDSSGWHDNKTVSTGSSGWRDDKRVSWSHEPWQSNSAWGTVEKDKEADATAQPAAPAQLVAPGAISEAPGASARAADVAEAVTHEEAAAPSGAVQGVSATSDDKRGMKRKEAPASSDVALPSRCQRIGTLCRGLFAGTAAATEEVAATPEAATAAFTDTAATSVSAANLAAPPLGNTGTNEEAACVTSEPAAATTVFADAAATVVIATCVSASLGNAGNVAAAAGTHDEIAKASAIHEPAAATSVIANGAATFGPAAAQLVADAISEAPAATARPVDVTEPVSPVAAAPTGAMHGAFATAATSATSANLAAPHQLVAGDVAADARTEDFHTPEEDPDILATLLAVVTAANLADTEQVAAANEETAKAIAIHEPAAATIVCAGAAASLAVPPHLGGTVGLPPEASAIREPAAATSVFADAAATQEAPNASPMLRAAFGTPASATPDDAANGAPASASDNSNHHQPAAGQLPALRIPGNCGSNDHVLCGWTLDTSYQRCGCGKWCGTRCHKCITCGAFFCWRCEGNAGRHFNAPKPRIIPPPPRRADVRPPSGATSGRIPAFRGAGCKRPVTPPKRPTRAEPYRTPRDARVSGPAMPPQQAPVMSPPLNAPLQQAPIMSPPLSAPPQQAPVLTPPLNAPPSGQVPLPAVLPAPPPVTLPSVPRAPPPVINVPLTGAPPPMGQLLPADHRCIMNDAYILDVLTKQGASEDEVMMLKLLEKRSEEGREACNCIAGPLACKCVSIY